MTGMKEVFILPSLWRDNENLEMNFTNLIGQVKLNFRLDTSNFSKQCQEKLLSVSTSIITFC